MTKSNTLSTASPLLIHRAFSLLSQTFEKVSTTSTKTWSAIALGTATAVLTTAAVKNMFRMIYWRSTLRDAKTGQPAPGPTPIPFLGNVLDLRVAYYETLHRYVDARAVVFWVHATPFLVINDEDALRRVLGGANGIYSKPKYFGYRSRTVSSAVDKERGNVAHESIAYDVNGDVSRVALDNMIRNALPKIKQRMNAVLRSLGDKNKIEPKEDTVHKVRRAIVALNLDILFGATAFVDDQIDKTNEQEDDDYIVVEDARRISDMIDFAGAEFARRMVNPVKVFFDILGNIRFLRDVAALISLGRRLGRSLDVAAAANTTTESTEEGTTSKSAAGVSWVHAWVGKVGPIGKLGKIVGLLMASTQTVPLTGVWLLHLVAQNDDVRLKVLEELHANGIYDPSDLDYDTLSSTTSLVYLEAVVKETLRMYPPFPLIQRQVQQDDILAGVTVPKGMIVYVVPWLVHRNERFWKDAHAFKPERFVKKEVDSNGKVTVTVAQHGDTGSDWLYLPFGRGPRMCAGSKLALAELKVLLIHAVLRGELTSERSGVIRDERFPELGMVPRGIRIQVASEAMN